MMRFASLALALCAPTFAASTGDKAVFSDFHYTGGDPADAVALPPGHYRNPILAGFHPDPAIVRVGDDFYLMTSSFGYWPGLPIWHSRDLVSWQQIGAAIDRREQLDLGPVFPSGGLYGPDLKHHAGIYYALSTWMGCGGNFVVTARTPRGPWSRPHWLGFEGIDPSIFFDTDGRAYILNNGPPAGPPRWPGHRAIWMQEIDLRSLTMIGPRIVVIDGGVDPATRPEWIEGPHLFRHDGWYYLIAAEGGTQERHSEVVFRARDVRGPFIAGPDNPILTQRDLPADRPSPVAATGHADMVELKDGSWWAVFLGTRPYAPGTYNTGRDIYLLPVTWRDGWPHILTRGVAVPRIAPRPPLAAAAAPTVATTGAFSFDDRFGSTTLATPWTFLRTPRDRWWRVGGGRLTLTPRSAALGSLDQPSLLMVRQAHARAQVQVTLRFRPTVAGEQAGLVAFQDERRSLAAALTRDDAGGLELRLQRRLATEQPVQGEVVARVPMARGPVRLRLTIDGASYRFAYAARGGWQPLGPALDGATLSTGVAGGFTGTMIGLFAYRPWRRRDWHDEGGADRPAAQARRAIDPRGTRRCANTRHPAATGSPARRWRMASISSATAVSAIASIG